MRVVLDTTRKALSLEIVQDRGKVGRKFHKRGLLEIKQQERDFRWYNAIDAEFMKTLSFVTGMYHSSNVVRDDVNTCLCICFEHFIFRSVRLII